MYRHHTSKPGDYRGWLHLHLPENPICWLLGHSPRAVVTEWRFGIAPSLWFDCRVCGRRYDDPEGRDAVTRAAAGGSRKDATDELTARRIENLNRLGQREFCAGVNRRHGWAGRQLVLHHQTLWPAKGSKRRRGWGDFGFKFHLGNQHSETPIDAHVKAGPFATYVTVGGIGGRFAALVGRGHKRDIALQVHGGQLWWKLWYDDDGGNDSYHRCDKWRQPRLWPWSRGRVKHRGWLCLRDGNIAVNPLNALWGPRLFHYTDVESKTAFVEPGQFPGDRYLVDFTLQLQERHRDHGPAWVRRSSTSWTVKWEADGEGIPVRNHDWKGDGILGSSESLPEGWSPADGNWLQLAVVSLEERVRVDRVRHRYSPPKGAVS